MIYLYYCPQMSDLASRIVECFDKAILGKISWDAFKDGFPNIRVRGAEQIRNKDVVFLACFETPREIFRQLAVIYEIPRLGVRSFKVILPFYSTGTMERVESEGEIATASTLARMLSATPSSTSGPTQIIIYDIHALQERFYFSDSVIPRLQSAIPLLKNRVETMDNITIVFPDEGAEKRFGGMFDGFPMVLCHKIRDRKERIVTVKEGDPCGKHAIIVDDLVMTGGTLLECKKALFEHGATEVSAYVTHGVFPKATWKNFLQTNFSYFWLTDSCPQTVTAIKGKTPFEVLSLSQPISDLLIDD